MKAMQMVEPARPLVLRDVDLPRPDGRAVLVRVEVCGVCHTDIHLVAGFYDLGEGRKMILQDRGVVLPLTLGHEIAGKVEAFGEKATDSGFKTGDPVVVYPWVGCGSCKNCTSGYENMCEAKPRSLGIFVDGGYSEYVLVPGVRYLVATQGISLSQAGPLACSGITSLSAVKKTGAGPGSLLAVIGVGGLGSTAIQLAKATGARIVALDIHEMQLELASKSGADQVVNTSEMAPEAVASSVKRLSDGKGVDAVVDFVGSRDTFSAGFRMLAKGGRLVSVGLFGGSAQFPLPIFVQRGIELAGSFTGTPADLMELVKLVRGGVVSPVVSEVLALEDVNLALDRLRAGGVRGRILVSPSR